MSSVTFAANVRKKKVSRTYVAKGVRLNVELLQLPSNSSWNVRCNKSQSKKRRKKIHISNVFVIQKPLIIKLSEIFGNRSTVRPRWNQRINIEYTKQIDTYEIVNTLEMKNKKKKKKEKTSNMIVPLFI